MRLVSRSAAVAMVVLSLAVAGAEDGNRPLSLEEIQAALAAGVSQSRVTDLVYQRGVTFGMTPAVAAALRSAGAGEELLNAVAGDEVEAARRRMEEERKASEAAALEKAKKQAEAAAEAAAKKGERKSGRAGTAAKTARAAPGKIGQMVTVPGGPFFMGCNESVDLQCDSDEKPGRTIEIAGFKIDTTEVTVDQYAKCVSAGACSGTGLTMPFYGNQDQPEFAEFCNWQQAGRGNHPINCVSWHQAVAFCEWSGKRLPTEAEWEKAARGTDGRIYPWGDTPFGEGDRVANIADETAKQRFAEWPIATGYDDGWVGTASVGSFPAGASPSGTLDMIGNVWEFTADEFEGGRADRGAHWGDDPRRARASNRGRNPSEDRYPGIGFRCVR